MKKEIFVTIQNLFVALLAFKWLLLVEQNKNASFKTDKLQRNKLTTKLSRIVNTGNYENRPVANFSFFMYCKNAEYKIMFVFECWFLIMFIPKG
jgi:hypothetical protein